MIHVTKVAVVKRTKPVDVTVKSLLVIYAERTLKKYQSW